MSKISIYKKIEDLTSGDKTETRVLSEWMRLCKETSVYMKPSKLTKGNQIKMIDILKGMDITNNRRIVMIRTLIKYLKLYENIKEMDYVEYEIYMGTLRRGECVDEKKKESREICEEIWRDKRNEMNLRLYCYMRNKDIKPKDMVEIKMDKSEIYIDISKGKLYIGDGEVNIDGKEILKMIILNREEKDYDELMNDKKSLREELGKVRIMYLFEKGGKKMNKENLIKMLTYRKSLKK